MIGYIKDSVKDEDGSMKDLMSLFKYSIGINQKKSISPDGMKKTIKTNKEIMEMLVSKSKTESNPEKEKNSNTQNDKKPIKKKKTKEVTKKKLWCDNPGCSNKALHRCSGCLVVAFCSKQCSIEFWPIHQKQCFKKPKQLKTINCISEVD